MIGAFRQPGRMTVHLYFDIAAWICAWLVARQMRRRGLLQGRQRTPVTDPGYFIMLGLGAIAGALLLGSLNMKLGGLWGIGHSVAGAVAGGIIGVELFKYGKGIRGSTGAQFVAPLAAGIAVGRLGCFFSGMPDYTYGTATTMPWGVDFGDGVPRHPVQLYESAAMLLFLAVYCYSVARGSAFFLRQGFYIFVGYYALQRFAWEFLKPYPAVVGPFNIFHLLCMALFAYSLLMMRQNHEFRAAIPEL
jgi:phosphatidylglycerol:prolipoprotein diacylglycerol transferase